MYCPHCGERIQKWVPLGSEQAPDEAVA
jgi:hypothetical protein